MENDWINGKNGWIILAILLAYAGFAGPSKEKEANSPQPKIIKMKVTAYCPCEKCCGKYADGKTSIGKDAWKTLGVAADPKLLAYGTKLEIPGIGIREVDDTGGAMRQNGKKGIFHIDVRFRSHQEAKEFGVKWLDVKILSPAT